MANPSPKTIIDESGIEVNNNDHEIFEKGRRGDLASGGVVRAT